MPDISSLPSPITAPILSTPDERIFEATSSVETVPSKNQRRRIRGDEELCTIYEIERTVHEIQAGGWRRIALQFPDHLLHDAAWVSNEFSDRLRQAARGPSLASLDLHRDGTVQTEQMHEKKKIFILADTSYGACCVDEVAAEHADADVVIHYGRACLSPTARLPVIYCFTKPPLSADAVVEAFREVYPDCDQKIILMSDLPYHHALPTVGSRLRDLGYSKIFVTDVVHDTASMLPNRTVPKGAAQDKDKEALRDWALFHIAEPSPSLLLTLTSRVSSIHVLPIPTHNEDPPKNSLKATEISTSTSLRRRYAMLTSLTTVPIFGIIVNTLSVRDYMGILGHVKSIIAAAGKKSYTFVVGKVNAAKVANFSEVGGWVVIGCWESSLFESGDFWKPMITPFELEVALRGDGERVWTGDWTGDFQAVLRAASGTGDDDDDDDSLRDTRDTATKGLDLSRPAQPKKEEEKDTMNDRSSSSSEEESEPPEYDLRTGRYVSQTRPTRHTNLSTSSPNASHTTTTTTTITTKTPSASASQSLIYRPTSTLTSPSTRDAAFPAAAFFRDKRSWQGLGSDFEVKYDDDGALVSEEGAVVEQGRAGLARGYRVGEGGEVT